jgi:hypothetical protein
VFVQVQGAAVFGGDAPFAQRAVETLPCVEGVCLSASQWATVMRRRWYIVVFSMICTIAGIYGVHGRTLSYEGCDYLALSGPSYIYEPFITDNPSIAIVTQMVSLKIMSESVESELQSIGALPDYSVAQTNTGSSYLPSYTSPTLEICASSDDYGDVIRTIHIVTNKFDGILAQIQGPAARGAYGIKPLVIYPASALPVAGRPSEAYLAVFLIGMIAVASLPVMVDAALQTSRRMAGSGAGV